MNVVINEKGERFKAIDIEDVAKSGKYNCVCCNERMVFVNKSDIRNCHFRHYPKSKCISNIDKTYNENKKSNFHYDWQKIFPKQNIEICFNEDDNKHIADIYLENNNNKLVIEIQHSPISEINIKERTDFYTKHNRKLLWIFDIKNSSQISKVKTHDRDICIIKFIKKIYFTSITPDMLLLDTGDEYLYKINDIIDADKEQITVSNIIKKDIFIENLKKDYDVNINNNLIFSNPDIEYYDFEKIISNCNVDNVSKDKLQIICSLISKNRFLYFNFKLLISSLSTLSNKNIELCNLLFLWFKNKFYKFNLPVKFGKYEGENYDDITDIKIKNWYAENLNCDCSKKYENKKCNKCDLLTNCNIESLSFFYNKTDIINNLDIYKSTVELYNNILFDNQNPYFSVNIEENKKLSTYIFKPHCDYNLFILLGNTYCNIDKCIFCNDRNIMKIIDFNFDICIKCFNYNKHNISEFTKKINVANYKRKKREIEAEKLIKIKQEEENQKYIKEKLEREEREKQERLINEKIELEKLEHMFNQKINENGENKISVKKIIMTKKKSKNRKLKDNKYIINDIYNYI